MQIITTIEPKREPLVLCVSDEYKSIPKPEISPADVFVCSIKRLEDER